MFTSPATFFQAMLSSIGESHYRWVGPAAVNLE